MATYFENIFPDDYDQLIRSGCDSAVLPIGAIEQHGPHLLLGCDSYIAMGMTEYVSELSGAVVFPLVPYSWIGGLRVWPGTIDLRPKNAGRYLEDICMGIVNMGFKRLVILCCHGGAREMAFLTASRVMKRTGIPVLAVFPTRLGIKEETGKILEKYKVRLRGKNCEGSSMLGGLKKIGRQDLLDKVLEITQQTALEFEHSSRDFKIEPLKNVMKISEVGHDYIVETQHVFPEATINPDAGMEMLKISAEVVVSALEKMKLLHEKN